MLPLTERAARTLYTDYVVAGTLWEHVSEINQAHNERMNSIVKCTEKMVLTEHVYV